MSQENVEIVRGMLEAFNRDDVDAVVAAFAEDCELYEPPEMPDRLSVGFRGHDGIREWVGKLRGIADVRFEPRAEGFLTMPEAIEAAGLQE
jgi:limonene-1,2-epoxide hydrolase